MESLPSKPRLCNIERGSDGYGFNLHGERGQHGQFIRAVDRDSPAEIAGLKSGDRLVEVNGINIERETHSQVVARIRAGGQATSMLVVDKELDVYCRKHGITVRVSMAESTDSDSESQPIITNGDHETEVHVNGEREVENGDVIMARIESTEEAMPDEEKDADNTEEQESEPELDQEPTEQQYDNDVEDHGYAEIRRDTEETPATEQSDEEEEEEELQREEEEEEKEEMAVAAVMGSGEAKTAEIKDVQEEEVIQPQEVNVEESIPAPPQEREEEPEVNIPAPEPEPILEPASVPQEYSTAPPSNGDMTDGPVSTWNEPEPEPEAEAEPEPEPEPPARVIQEPVKKAESTSIPPPRPNEAPKEKNKSEMEKARILAVGRKKKKEASSRKWEDKYATFNNL